MALRIEYTSYGRPACEQLETLVREYKNDDPFRAVTVVVPTNMAGVAIRRVIGAKKRGIAAVNFLKLFDLAERLAGSRVGGEDGRRPLPGPVIGATVRNVLETDPGLFGASARHPATEQALVQAYRDLRDLTDQELDMLASQSRRAAEVVRVHRQVRDRLKGRWCDGQDLNHLAIAALESEPIESEPIDDVLEELGPVIIHLPQRVTRSQGRMIGALARRTTVAVVAGLTGNHKADAAVRESIGRMGEEPQADAGISPAHGQRIISTAGADEEADAGISPAHGQRIISTAGADEEVDAGISPAHGQRIISTAGADEEVRVAVREVVNATQEGIPLDRIAVLSGSGMSTIRHLQDHLTAAGIPFNGPSGRTLAESLVGRGVLALLNLHNRDFRRDEVFDLLSVAAPSPMASTETTGQTRPVGIPVVAWERVARRAGVVRGTEQWRARLGGYAQELREAGEREQDDPDQTERWAEWHRREADHTDSLARFMAELIDDLSPDPEPTTWEAWCQWIKDLIGKYLADDSAVAAWPESEQHAADQIQNVLDGLANLDRIEASPRPTAFRHALTSELATPTKRTGRVGHGVLTELIGASTGMELRRAILIGMAEGTFPHSPADNPLLPDRERRATGGDLTLISDRLDEQHRHFLVVLASTEISTLIYARSNSREACEQYPSRWLLDTATALAGQPVDSTNLESLAGDRTPEWFEHVPSFSGRVLHADFPATAQEFRLQAIAHANQAGRPPRQQPLSPDPVARTNQAGQPHEDPDLVAHTNQAEQPPLSPDPVARTNQRGYQVPDDDPILARGAEMMAARASDRFTRFDGNLAGLDTAGLIGDAVSPTSLEMWADCPMRYLFRHVLRVQAADQPEELSEISASEKGSLIHRILELFLCEQLEASRVPPPGQRWSGEQQDRLVAIGTQQCEEAEARGLTGSPVFWGYDRSRILFDLRRFLMEDYEQRRRTGVTTIAGELGFGAPDDDLEAVTVELPRGRQVRFRGRADRVDQGRGDKLLVTDYKTGKADGYRDLDARSQNGDPVQRGTRLQLPVYGLAARALTENPDAPVTTQYWFVTEDGGFHTFGYPLDDGAMDRFRTVVDAITEGIEAGVFCDRPQPDRTEGQYSQRCDYCNADRLGTQDRRREWETMQERDELAGYRHLAEPPDDSEEEPEEEPDKQ